MFKAPNTKPNYLYAIASVALVLFLLGLFGVIVLEGQALVNSLKEKVEIITELSEDTTPEQVDSLKQFLASSIFCKENSIRFISREKGAALLQKEFGEEFLKLDMPNPLYDVLTFNVKANWMHPDSLGIARSQIKEFPFVNDVFYQENLADIIGTNLRKISIGILVAGFFFVFIAIALILNTIRLALYDNRFLIKNMELVGASWEFISKPYLRRSFWHGLLSGLAAVAGLGGLIALALQQAPEFESLLNWTGLTIIFSSLLCLGVLIPVVGTYYVVNKYLRMRVDDLY